MRRKKNKLKIILTGNVTMHGLIFKNDTLKKCKKTLRVALK